MIKKLLTKEEHITQMTQKDRESDKAPTALLIAKVTGADKPVQPEAYQRSSLFPSQNNLPNDLFQIFS